MAMLRTVPTILAAGLAAAVMSAPAAYARGASPETPVAGLKSEHPHGIRMAHMGQAGAPGFGQMGAAGPAAPTGFNCPYHMGGRATGFGYGNPWMMGPGMMGQGMMGYGMPGPGMMGPGMMGQGMMGYGMPGPGMMGPGPMGYGMAAPGMMGPGMMAPGFGGWQGYGGNRSVDRDLSADDVRAQLERSLQWHGNKNVKLGDVTEADDDTIVADIVTQDGSLVQRFRVDRHTGQWQQAE